MAKVKDLQDFHGAVAAIFRLREQFAPVARFLDDPQYTIVNAKHIYANSKPDRMSRAFTAIARHQAEVGLLLHVGTLASLRLEINELSKKTADFNPEQDDVVSLMKSVVETGGKAEKSVDYVRDCLDVLAGRKNALSNLDGPQI